MDEPTTTIQKISTAFDQHLEKYQAVFQEAYDRVMSEIKDEIKDTKNFVLFVVRAMHAVKDADLHGLEKKEIVIDIVRKVVEAMPISDEDKAELHERAVPTVQSVIDVLVYAAKGYMYLKHQAEEAVDDAQDQCVRCQTSCLARCRGCRRAPSEPAAAVSKAVRSEGDVEAIINSIYDTIKTSIRYKRIGVENIVSIGSSIMQIVEEYPNLAGYQKKQIVINITHRLVDEIPMDDTAKGIIHVAIDTTMSAAIDFIIKASRGEIEVINKLVAAVDAQCAKCC